MSVATDQRTRALVRARVGQTTLSKDLFTTEQRQTFDRLMAIADRNPNLIWRENDPNHNCDFIVLEGHIEAVKEFHLKAAFIERVSIRAEGQPTLLKTDGDLYVTVPVTVEKDGRVITMSGGSSIKECGAFRKGKPNKRAFHDAVARAQTRGLKIAMEMMLGFAFVNLAIIEVFGVFETEEPGDGGAPPKPRNVTPDERPDGPSPESAGGPQPKRSRALGAELYHLLQDAVKEGRMSKARMNAVWNEAQRNIDRPVYLEGVIANAKKEIGNTGAPA